MLIEEKKFKDYKLEVKYYSQYLDINLGIEFALRACGITCVYMILKYLNKIDLSLDNLYKKGVEEGGFNNQNDWSHDYFVNLFKEYNLDPFRMENMRDKDINLIAISLKNNYPVIVSVERRLFDKRDFHMILITGFREDEVGDIVGFYYHEPASLYKEENKGKYNYVDIKTFYLSWRRMAIFANKIS